MGGRLVGASGANQHYARKERKEGRRSGRPVGCGIAVVVYFSTSTSFYFVAGILNVRSSGLENFLVD